MTASTLSSDYKILTSTLISPAIARERTRKIRTCVVPHAMDRVQPLLYTQDRGLRLPDNNRGSDGRIVRMHVCSTRHHIRRLWDSWTALDG